MPAAALAIPALIGVGGSLTSGIMGAKAAGRAADIESDAALQAAAMATEAADKAASGVTTARQGAVADVWGNTDRANELLGTIFNQQTSTLSPYLQAGQQGVTTLMEGFAPGGSLTKEFTLPTAEEAAATPGFQFQMDEAMKAMTRSAAARGALGSGGTSKALNRYGQNIASTYYQNAVDNALKAFQTNRSNTMSGLTTLAGLGQFGTSQFNTAAANYGDQASRNLLNAGYYAGNTGIDAAKYSGNIGFDASKLAGDDLIQAANARAAGVIGRDNARQGIVGGMTTAAQYYTHNMLGTPEYSSTPTSSGSTYTPTRSFDASSYLKPVSTPQATWSLPDPPAIQSSPNLTVPEWLSHLYPQS